MSESFTAPNPVADGAAAFMEVINSADNTSSEPVETEVTEEVSSEEVSEESTTEESSEAEGEEVELEEGEEPKPVKKGEKKEEEKEESSELMEIKEKAARTAKALQKRIKQESDKVAALQAKVNDLQGEGIELAREIIKFKKAGDVHNMLKTFGLDGNEVLKFYAKYLDDPEVVKQIGAAKSIEKNMKREEIERKEAEIAARESRVIREGYATEARGVINKFSDKIPVVAAMQEVMGGKLEDQIITTVTQMFSSRDPEIMGCKDFPSAVKKILPKFEADFRKKYKPLIDAFSKVEPKAQKQDKKSEAKPEEKKPATTAKKPEPKPEAKTTKPVVKGTPSRSSSTSSEHTKSRDAIADSIRAFKNAGG